MIKKIFPAYNRLWQTPIRLYVFAAIAGFSLMAVEIVGVRVITPVLGGSTYVWTSVIGVILAAMSYGYHLGGKSAARHSQNIFLGNLFAYASVAIMWIVIVRHALPYIVSYSVPIELSALFVSGLLFSPCAVVFGMISPYIGRMVEMGKVENSIAYGNVFAWSTVGSILGTFVAGYALIPLFNSDTIIVTLGILMLLISIVIRVSRKLLGCALVMCLVALAFAFVFAGGEISTPYSIVKIVDQVREGRSVRLVSTDPFGYQCGVYPDSDELVFDYTQKIAAMVERLPAKNNLFLAGACVYTLPRYFGTHYPDMVQDIVEIDPGMTEIAQYTFSFEPTDNMHIFHEDARTYLTRIERRYDVLVLDAFQNTGSIPFQLVMVEMATELSQHMADRGVVIANLIGAVDGDQSRFVRSYAETMSQLFSYVYLVPTAGMSSTKRQNIILVAGKDASVVSTVLADFPEARKADLSEDALVLTDQYAPVELFQSRSWN